MNYQRAHIAIIKAQFTVKRLRDGMAVRVLLVPPLSPSLLWCAATGAWGATQHRAPARGLCLLEA